MSALDLDLDLVMTTWAALDAERSVHGVDREAIRSTESARSLVLDLFVLSSQTIALDKAAYARDLFNACARLGTLMAEAGASPSLVAGAIDSAIRALTDTHTPFDASRVAAARASLVEGYVGSVRDAERLAALASWEYPACVVRLDASTSAVSCSYPSDDPEAITAWAGRIAGRLTKEKIRRVVLAGTSSTAIAELTSALDLVGIQIQINGAGPKSEGAPVEPAVSREKTATDSEEADGQMPTNTNTNTNTSTSTKKSRSWLRLPWRK